MTDLMNSKILDKIEKDTKIYTVWVREAVRFIYDTPIEVQAKDAKTAIAIAEAMVEDYADIEGSPYGEDYGGVLECIEGDYIDSNTIQEEDGEPESIW